MIQFLGENIEVTLNNGITFVGYACDFEWGDDEFESCLGIYEDFHEWNYVGIFPNDIKSIKIIERPQK